jgi:AAA15 family ATPase/GTPase
VTHFGDYFSVNGTFKRFVLYYTEETASRGRYTMLIQFTVENFLSFKEQTVFSLLATADAAHPDHLIATGMGAKKNILRAAAIYGPNASGKSNLIKAMKFARDLVLTGTSPEKTIAVTPFKLGSVPNQTSRFQFIFAYKGIEYSYGFKLDSLRIVEEFLYAAPHGREVKYFERFTSEELKTEVDFGPVLTKKDKERRLFLRYKAADTRASQLLLTAMFEGNLKHTVQELQPVIEWFGSVLTIIGAESTSDSLETRTHHTKALKDFLATFLRTSDTGIKEIITTEVPLDWDRDLPWVPSGLRNQITRQFKTPTSGESGSMEYEEVVIDGPDSTRAYIRQNEKGELSLIQILLKHTGEEGQDIEFLMNEESEGTQRVIHLIPMLFDMNEGKDRVIVLDELDRRLHPHLSRLIVQAALQCQSRNQLLFTTHDTNLLDLDLLRRDEIWFVEKDKAGRSALYSLAEFKVRPDLQIEKGYLNGRFGAVPFIGDISSLGWRDESKSKDKTEESVHA